MESCCLVVGIIIVGYIAYLAISAANDAAAKSKAEKERQIFEKNQRIAGYNSDISNRKNDFHREIRNFFDGNGLVLSSYLPGFGDVNNYSPAMSTYHRLNSVIESMKETNSKLTEEGAPSQHELIATLSDAAKEFAKFANMISGYEPQNMIDGIDYGNVNKVYWNEVQEMDEEDVTNTINSYIDWIDEMDIAMFSSIDPDFLARSIWFYALDKPYSAENFKIACSMFAKIYKKKYTDVTIAEFYAIKQMGGDDVLRDRVRELLKNSSNNNSISETTEELTTIASGLMWMNAYQEENMILQHMLSTGQEMSEKAQSRLHALSNGGGKAPAGYDVESNKSQLYFDTSSLAWKDDEYTGLFENLAFQDKILSYSLGLRDENKEIFVEQGLKMPGRDAITKKLNDVFSEEYGDAVIAHTTSCVALSGSGEESLEGILVKAQECPQMGILVHVVRIGKKFIIKFYTLFMPSGTSLSVQKQQAISLYKKLSPSVSMWESSLKDTILIAIQELLNSATVRGAVSTSSDENTETVF